MFSFHGISFVCVYCGLGYVNHDLAKSHNEVFRYGITANLIGKLGGVFKIPSITPHNGRVLYWSGVSAAITDIPGSSAWFDRAFVTYNAKVEMLGAAEDTIQSHGAVSEVTAMEMVQGALGINNIGVSISGVADLGGGSAEKPVGTVCFAWADDQGWLKVDTQCFSGDRAEVRQQA